VRNRPAGLISRLMRLTTDVGHCETLRSGLLMSSIVAAMPVWNILDPMPIVSVAGVGENQEDESLQDIVDSQQEST